MKHLPLIIAAAASFALIAPAASAKTGVRQAERACTSAAKALEGVKSAKSSDDGEVFTNTTAIVPLRITHEDGTKSRMTCTLDRNSGEVTTIEPATEE